MKISDAELLRAIWENQLRLTSRGVLNRYVGGRWALCREDDTWFAFAVAEHRMTAEQVTTRIGRKQLIARIRRLIEFGRVKSHYGSELLTFSIIGQDAWDAFVEARKFWKEQGIPEGSANGIMNTVVMPETDIDRLAQVCAEMLLHRFGDQGPNTPETKEAA